MNQSGFKLGAAGCCVAYVLAYLLLPFIAIKLIGIGLPGKDCMSINGLCYLPLLMGIGMAVCSFALPGKIGAIVCGIGAFLPLVLYFPVEDSLVRDGLALASTVIPGLGAALAGLGSYAVGQILTTGIGVFLPLLFGIGAAVLCYLSENAGYSKPRPAPEEDDDWR